MKRIKVLLVIGIVFVLFGCKQVPNEIITLTTDGNENVKIIKNSSSFEFIITQVIAVGSVILSAMLGFFYWKKQEKESRKFQNHFDFLSDINDYYILIHNMIQDLSKYNELLTNFTSWGFKQYCYDSSLSHFDNRQNFESLLMQKKQPNFYANLKVYNLEDKWKLLEDIANKYITFDFFIETIKSLNKSAYLHSFFVDKKLKKEFDDFVEMTHKLTQNNYANLYICEYCEDVLTLFESAKKFVDKKSNSIKRG